MTPRLKTQWLEKLRSGEYKQGAGSLRSRDEFCPLGVLADVIDSKGWSRNSWNGSYTDLPEEVLHPDVQEDVVVLNDDKKQDFEQIADYIEGHVDGRG